MKQIQPGKRTTIYKGKIHSIKPLSNYKFLLAQYPYLIHIFGNEQTYNSFKKINPTFTSKLVNFVKDFHKTEFLRNNHNSNQNALRKYILNYRLPALL